MRYLKTFLVIFLFLIAIPIVIALWNPFSWGECMSGFFGEDITAKELPFGAVEYNGEIIAYDDFWCKVQGDYIVCYSCYDGRCQYGTGRCKSGETCLEIETKNDERSFYNSFNTILK